MTFSYFKQYLVILITLLTGFQLSTTAQNVTLKRGYVGKLKTKDLAIKNYQIAKPAKGKRFTSITQFLGTYKGKLDGRNASLNISISEHNPAWYGFQVILKDLDRNVTFYGNFYKPRKNFDHIVKDLGLKSKDGKHAKKITRLYLHTWDTNYITAFDKWGKGTYGYLFSKVNLPKAKAGKPKFSTTNQFVGTYKGKLDGRNATLSIRPINGRGSQIQIILKDVDRNVTFYLTCPRLSINGQKHILKSMTLRSKDGKHKKTISKMVLHTWNANYLSATSLWNGKQYGMLFVRVK